MQEEAAQHGPLTGTAVPSPPEDLADDEPAHAYLRFETVDAAKAVKPIFEGRTFDENTVKVTYATEDDFDRAQAGEWIREDNAAATAPPPGAQTEFVLSSCTVVVRCE